MIDAPARRPLGVATLESRRKEVESLIVNEPDLGRVFDRVMDFVRDFAGRGSHWNEVIILKREQKDHQDKERALGATPETSRKRNELLDRALRLWDAVAAEANTSSVDETSAPDLDNPTEKEVAADLASLSFDQARDRFAADRRIKMPSGPLAYFCEGVCRGYRRGRAFRLRDISVDLRPGEITGLVGPNGSGKTTLLRIIAGELLPDGGQYCYPLLQPEANGPRQIDWGLVRLQIAHVRQRPDRWFGRVVSNLYRQASFFGLHGADNEMEVDFLLERLGLAEYREASWTELAGGFQMRFELAKALVARPKLLVLDEPLAPLDPHVRSRFLRDLKDLALSPRRPLSVIISSQHLYETESIADKLLFLENGTPEFYGAPERIGAERKENVFELNTLASSEELKGALGRLITACDSGGQGTFLVRSSRSVQPNDVLSALVKSHITVHYFRDLSHSARSLFGDRRQQ